MVGWEVTSWSFSIQTSKCFLLSFLCSQVFDSISSENRQRLGDESSEISFNTIFILSGIFTRNVRLCLLFVAIIFYSITKCNTQNTWSQGNKKNCQKRFIFGDKIFYSGFSYFLFSVQ